MTHVNVFKKTNKCGAGSTELPEFLIPSKAYTDKWHRLPSLQSMLHCLVNGIAFLIKGIQHHLSNAHPQSRFSKHPVKGSTSKELASLVFMLNTFR